MPLPTIAPYDIDAGALVAANVTDWRLDPSRATVLVHDMQEHFLGVFDTSAGAGQVTQAVTRTAAVLGAARGAGVPVMYTAQPAAQDLRDRGLLTDFWGPGLQDERAAGIVPELAPHPGDVVLTKWRYSAFYRSDLRERMLVRGNDQLVITGVYAHIGCLTTALVAFMDGIQVFFVADAMADFGPEEHEMAARFVAGRCGQVCTAADVIAAFGAGSASAVAS